MHRFLSWHIFMACPMFLFGGFWDWFHEPLKNEKVDFYCPHHCGEWGSASIRSLEWEFIQCLYNAHEMENYIEENYTKRNKKYRSVKFSKDFVPEEFLFDLDRPQNFDSRWYQKVLDENQFWVVSLSECIPGWRGCDGCISALWKVRHFDDEAGNHIGKRFIRTLDSENYDYYFQRDEEDENADEDEGPYYDRLLGKNEYEFRNFIDFHHACLALENDLSIVKNANGCRDYSYSPLFVEQIETRFAIVCKSLLYVQEIHRNIFADCAREHGSPSAFYNLALLGLSKGEYEESLDYFRSLFDKVKLDSLQMNLASEIYQSMGSLEVEIALYDEAIITLGKAIESNPNNKDAYFERAIAYFEKGEFDLALNDFFNGGKKASVSAFNEDPELRDYAIGIVTGTSRGLADASLEFLPGICSSLRGVGNLLWATANHPIDSSKLFASSILEFYKFLRTCNKAELAEILVPEMYELVVQWDRLSAKNRGELAGYSLGKYGTDILLPIAVVKGVKYVKAYNDIRKVEKLCTLKALGNSPESRAALEKAATKWNAQRIAWFERVELEIDKQNKHVKEKHNFDASKAEWIHPNPEKKLKEMAGRGQKVVGTPGEAGYKERVDFGEVIGYYIDRETSERVPTTMGIIHYSKEGAHIVPSKPK